MGVNISRKDRRTIHYILIVYEVYMIQQPHERHCAVQYGKSSQEEVLSHL